MKLIFIFLSLLLLSACAHKSSTQSQGVLINDSRPSNLNCEQLDIKIRRLKETPPTDVFSLHNTQIITPFQFKSEGASQVKALEDEARRKGCYSIRNAPSVTPPPAIKSPSLPSIPRVQEENNPVPRLNFEACFSKCKSYTSRTNEQCFDSCK